MPEIFAVLRKDVEDPDTKVPTALHEKCGEVWIAVLVADGQFAIKHNGLRRQLCDRRGDGGIALGEIIAVLAEQSDVFVLFVDLYAIAVELHFVGPHWMRRRLLPECR